VVERMHRNRREGFTLVELLIVIAIIGVLAAIAIPSYIIAQKRSKTKACIANMKIIHDAIARYMTDFGADVVYSGQDGGSFLVHVRNKEYLISDPRCPEGKTYYSAVGDYESQDIMVFCRSVSLYPDHVFSW
jgi:prepilin-type N-terminal cleavage/methylation domain-containing protein